MADAVVTTDMRKGIVGAVDALISEGNAQELSLRLFGTAEYSKRNEGYPRYMGGFYPPQDTVFMDGMPPLGVDSIGRRKTMIITALKAPNTSDLVNALKSVIFHKVAIEAMDERMIWLFSRNSMISELFYLAAIAPTPQLRELAKSGIVPAAGRIIASAVESGRFIGNFELVPGALYTCEGFRYLQGFNSEIRQIELMQKRNSEAMQDGYIARLRKANDWGVLINFSAECEHPMEKRVAAGKAAIDILLMNGDEKNIRNIGGDCWAYAPREVKQYAKMMLGTMQETHKKSCPPASTGGQRRQVTA
jgi:hypothetical protein